MGLKEQMMNTMVGNMSKEERMEMMEKMMDTFFAQMTPEEKQEMMGSMMPKMMKEMMGGEGSPMKGMKGMMSMMGTMVKTTGSKDNTNDSESGFDPMSMCKEMMGSIRQGQKIAGLATPEIHGLFEEWAEQIESEIMESIQNNKANTIKDIAGSLNISESSVYFFILRLAQKGQIDLAIKKSDK